LPVSPLNAEKKQDISHLMDMYHKRGLLIADDTVPMKKVT